MKILFTCVGTSDPVRDYHDGPMLHIIRHYRPDKICALLTKEISDKNSNDNRLGITEEYIRKNWNGYSPEFELIRTNIEDPSDLDAVSDPITSKVTELAALPDTELLLNLSSGTPQMKTVLAMLSCDTRFNAVGIQVKNHENASGTSERTNRKDYDADVEHECNEDERADAKNRCVEPKLLHLERQQKKEQILALLEQRNYSAVYAMKNAMPDELKALVGHLEARDSMQYERAKSMAQSLKLPFSLYPKKEVRGYNGCINYDEVSEAYLILLNRQHRKQYEELVLRLNPLVVCLELRVIESSLNDLGIRLTDIFEKPCKSNNYSYTLIPENFERLLPDVFIKTSLNFRDGLQSRPASIELCLHIIENLPLCEQRTVTLISSCHLLNKRLRNDAAHKLTSVTEKQIYDASGLYPTQLLTKIGDLIESIYPECDRALFTIYKRCGDYIKEKLM